MQEKGRRRQTIKSVFACVFALFMACSAAGCVPQTDDGGDYVPPPDMRAEWEKQSFDTVDKVIPRPQVNNEQRVEILKDLNFSGGFTVYNSAEAAIETPVTLPSSVPSEPPGLVPNTIVMKRAQKMRPHTRL